MAYNPTTWGSNDVITKDRLNKMEQGIVSASKLSGTDIDTDKDCKGRRFTNIGGISGSLLTCVAGNTIRAWSTTVRKSPPENAGWVKVFEAVLGPEHVGTSNSYRVKYAWMIEKQGYGRGYSRIYVNGVAKGRQREISSLVREYADASEDIGSLSAGDRVQIYVMLGSTECSILVKDVRLCCEYASAGVALTPSVTISE